MRMKTKNVILTVLMVFAPIGMIACGIKPKQVDAPPAPQSVQNENATKDSGDKKIIFPSRYPKNAKQ